MRALLFFFPLFFLFQATGLCANDKKTQEEHIWTVTANIENMGKLNFYMLSDTTNSPVVLKSRKDRDKVILGNFKARLFRFFQKRKNKNSMAVMELKENGKIYFLAMTMPLKEIEKISDDTIKGNIYDNGLTDKLGDFVAVRTNLTATNLPPLAPYQQISDSIVAITEGKIYNPALVKNKGWLKFSDNIRSKSAKIDDDLEFMLLFFSQVNAVEFSHYSLLKTNIDLEKTFREPQINGEILAGNKVYLQFKTLSGRVEEIDSIFAQYAGYQYYIIDLRDTPGGKFETTYKLASYLSQQQNKPAGIFAGRLYYEDAVFRNNPTGFYVLQENDFSHFAAVLEEKQAVKIEFKSQHPLQSKICILTSNQTASSCEPLVYGLKGEKNIQIIGEKTAGAMLSPTVYPAGNGYFLIIPTADYLTQQGESIEGRGVQPDVKVKSEKALDFVLKIRQ